MRIFMTGATGFAGSYLVEDLLSAGDEVFGLVHEATSHQPQPERPGFHPIPGDLLNLEELKAAVRVAQPEVIYHLAGQAFPGRSWMNPALTLAINSGGTANLLEAAHAFGSPRVVVVTSALIYGAIEPDTLPVTEERLPNPDHPYGISKVSAGMLCRVYWQQYALPVVEARPFNHIGPRQARGFVVPDFASQLANIKVRGTEPKMVVGNLSAKRDFTDVRDVARAYRLLADRGEPGETYLICSGRSVTIQHLLDTLIELAGVSVAIELDPTRARSSETPILRGSYAKIQKRTGWQPEYEIRRSLADTLEYWLTRPSK
jgi:GDP-4-dehydro-6-deoxy-D-mannose reductase